MPTIDAQVTLFVTAAAGAALFIVQSICWFLLRSKRMQLPRWKRLSRLCFMLGTVLTIGGLLALVLGTEALRPGATLALGAGAFNAFIALFHQRTITWLERSQR